MAQIEAIMDGTFDLSIQMPNDLESLEKMKYETCNHILDYQNNQNKIIRITALLSKFNTQMELALEDAKEEIKKRREQN